MKILLADDSVTAQNMGKKILSEAGHEVVCVSNGAAALKKISEQEPDLVILDIYMPGYSGLEVCQKLKDTSSTADVPVVLTVGKLEPFRKEDAQRVRAEALIIKPFEASELAAAVARFAEIASAKPAKTKNKGKLGPQPKAKPQWDEPSQDEFVTTTQKLEEQEVAAGKSSADVAAETAEATVERQVPQTGSEFEVNPAPEASEPAAVAHNAVEPSLGRDFGSRSSAVETDTRWPEAAAAEFSVQAGDARSGDEQPQAMAAAAGAGGEIGNGESHPEMIASVASAGDFTVAAPFEPPSEEPAAPERPIAGGEGLPKVPDVAPSAELSVTAEPAAGPGVDPAFDPDRTQWVTQFATHFGIKEETVEESEGPASEQTGTEPGSATPEEIAVILSNLPEGGSGSPPERSPQAEGDEEGLRPWPVEASGFETSGWKAEEVPLEDQDNSTSLAEEMNQASQEFQPGVPAEAGQPETASLVPAASTLEVQAAENGWDAATTQAASPDATDPVSVVGMEAVQPESRVEEPVRETDAVVAGADRVTGVMHSAAMAIATRATVSAVASQLHGQPQGESVGMGPSVIEELVEQVLERLKPKLIAEIKRELKTAEEK